MIRLEDVSIRYLITYDRVKSLKEYLVQRIQNKVGHEEFWALQGISLSIQMGEVLGIIGQNGAGSLRCSR